MDFISYANISKEAFNAVPFNETSELEPSFLLYIKDLNLIICKDCKEAIYNPEYIGSFRNHLKEYHPAYYKSLGSKDLSTVITALYNIKARGVKALFKDTDNPLLPNTIYLKELDITTDTFACTKCNYITISWGVFSHHTKIHEYIGRPKVSIPKDLYIEGIPVQIFNKKRDRRAFIPRLPIIDDTIIFTSKTATSRDIESPSKVQHLINKYNKEREVLKTTPRDRYLFLTTFKITEYLKDKDIPTLVKDVNPDFILNPKALANKENRYLFYIRDRAKVLFHEFSLQIENFPSSSRLALKRSPLIEGAISTSEFTIHATKGARDTYGLELGKFILYLIYLYKERLSSNTLDSENNEPSFSSSTTRTIQQLLDLEDLILDEEITLESQEIFDNILIRLYISVLRTPINYTTLGTKYFKNPLLTYLVLRNYDYNSNPKDSKRWAELGALLVYISRLALIAVVTLDARLAIKANKPEINLEARFNHYYKETLDFSTDKVYKELYRIYINIRRYNYTRKSTNNLITEIDKDRFIIKDTTIIIPNLRDYIEILTNSLEDRLFNNLLLFLYSNESLLGVNIDINKLQDDINFINPNTSLTDQPTFTKYKDLYLKFVFNRESIINKYFYPENPPNPLGRRFDSTRVKEYIANRNLFIKDLLLLTYLVIGAPTRGSELILLRYISLEGAPRNIYLDTLSKEILLNLEWSKTRNRARESNENIRILSPAISRLYIYYIILVIPFFNYIKKEYLNIKEISPYLFEIDNKQLDSSLLSRLLVKASKEAFITVKGLGLSPFRDLLIYIIINFIDEKEILQGNYKQSNDYTNSSILDILSNHTTKVRDSSYANTTSTFSNTTRSLFYKSKEFSRAYNNFFNLYRLRDIESILKREDIETSDLAKEPSKLEGKRRAKSLASSKASSYIEDSDDSYLGSYKAFDSENSDNNSDLEDIEEDNDNSDNNDEVIAGPSTNLTRDNLSSLDRDIFKRFEFLDNEENLLDDDTSEPEYISDLEEINKDPNRSPSINLFSPLTIREKEKNKEIDRSRSRSISPTLIASKRSLSKRPRAPTTTKSPKVVKKARDNIVINLPKRSLNYSDYPLVKDKESTSSRKEEDDSFIKPSSFNDNNKELSRDIEEDSIVLTSSIAKSTREESSSEEEEIVKKKTKSKGKGKKRKLINPWGRKGKPKDL
jgi:hypothetical protein